MPKVDTYFYRSKKTATATSTDIHFGYATDNGRKQSRQTEKCFYIKLPEHLARIHGGDHLTNDDISKLKKAYADLIDKVDELGRDVKKVIGYIVSSRRFKKGANEYNQFTETGEFDNRPPNVYGEQKLTIEFAVGWITSFSNGKQFFSAREGEVGQEIGKRTWGNWSHHTFIDWTEDREKWFINTYASFSKLIATVSDFFKADESKLLSAIDERQKLIS